MAFGLILFDLLYFALATLLYGISGWAALRVGQATAPFLTLPLACLIAVLTFLLTLIFLVAVGVRLCPPLKPGRYTLFKGPVFFSWTVRSLFRRILLYPPLRVLLYSVATLRFLALRALGGKVAFTANVSNDVEILDPSLVTLGPGSICGALVFLSGHFIQGKLLVLGPIEIGESALLGNGNLVGPNVTLGPKAMVLPRTNLSMGVRIGAAARVGAGCLLDAGVEVGARARIGHRVHVPRGTRIPEGARYKPSGQSEVPDED